VKQLYSRYREIKESEVTAIALQEGIKNDCGNSRKPDTARLSVAKYAKK